MSDSDINQYASLDEESVYTTADEGDNTDLLDTGRTSSLFGCMEPALTHTTTSSHNTSHNTTLNTPHNTTTGENSTPNHSATRRRFKGDLAPPISPPPSAQHHPPSSKTLAITRYTGDEEWSNATSDMDDQTMLALLNEDDEISSDEDSSDRSTIRNIKDQITSKLLQEMSDELQIYKPNDASGKHEIFQDKSLSGLDPKIRQGILKIRKLDRILEKKTKKEKEVKKSRILLQRSLKKELDELQSRPDARKKQPKEEINNTMKFLSLTLPAKHNIGVDIEDDEDNLSASRPVTPVFQTQLPHNSSSTSAANTASTSTTNTASTSTATSAATNNQSRRTTTSHSEPASRINDSKTSSIKSEKSKKDYISRNIELAGDADQIVPMTEAEKNRVVALLEQDDDDLDLEQLEANQSAEDQTIITQLSLYSTEGFRPNDLERSRLSSIDDRLKSLAPYEHCEQFAYLNESNLKSETSVGSILSRTDHVINDARELGQIELRSTKEQRELNERLGEIDAMIAMYDDDNDIGNQSSEGIDSPSPIKPTIGEEQMRALLESCKRNSKTAMSAIYEEESDCNSEIYSEFAANNCEFSKPLSREIIDQLLTNNGMLTDQLSQVNRQLAISECRPTDTSTRNDCITRELRPRKPASFLPRIDPRGSPLTGQNTMNVTSVSSMSSNDLQSSRIYSPKPPVRS